MPLAVINETNSTSGAQLSNPPPDTYWTQDPAVQENMERYHQYYHPFVHSAEYFACAGKNNRRNTSLELMKAANTLRTQDQFYITESTNDGVIVLWKRSEYEIEALRQLSDKEIYHLVAIESSRELVRRAIYPASVQATIKRICRERNERIHYLERNGHITRKESLAMQVMEKNQKLPYVYFKPNLNKPFHPTTGSFEATAVVATTNGPLYSLDQYLSKIVSPITNIIPGNLKSSSQLIELIASASSASKLAGKPGICCIDGHSSEHVGFATAEVVDLFSSIDIKLGVAAAHQIYSDSYGWLCCKYQQQQLLPPVDPEAFRLLLEFVLTNTHFSYQNKLFYKQNKGIPIGGCISPFVAHCFMFQLTREKISDPPSWMMTFQRSANHLFFLSCFHSSHGNDTLQEFLNCITKLNIKCKQIVCAGHGSYAGCSSDQNRNRESNIVLRTCNFRDVTISFDPMTLTFESKPNLTVFPIQSYIYRTSNHPKKEFYNVLLSEYHLLKSLSSSNEIYQESCKILRSKLYPRGYSRLECFVAQKTVNDRQPLSAFSNSEELPKRPQGKEIAYDTFNLNAKYDHLTNKRESEECVSEIYDFIGKHYVNSKNKITVLSQR